MSLCFFCNNNYYRGDGYRFIARVPVPKFPTVRQSVRVGTRIECYMYLTGVLRVRFGLGWLSHSHKQSLHVIITISMVKKKLFFGGHKNYNSNFHITSSSCERI